MCLAQLLFQLSLLLIEGANLQAVRLLQRLLFFLETLLILCRGQPLLLQLARIFHKFVVPRAFCLEALPISIGGQLRLNRCCLIARLRTRLVSRGPIGLRSGRTCGD